jgi:hypothetical protein
VAKLGETPLITETILMFGILDVFIKSGNLRRHNSGLDNMKLYISQTRRTKKLRI